jgi:hypothetical protein
MNAVVWIGRERALVVRDQPDGAPTTDEVAIPRTPAITPPVLAEVAHRIGDVDRILVLGDDDLRTALEREIVAIGHHPEAIREGDLLGPVDAEALLERLRRLG